MGQKTSRHFTLMIMPETAGAEVRRLRVARRTINFALGSVTILFLIAAGSVAGNVIQYFDQSAATVLDREYAELKERIASLDGRINQLTTSVDTIKTFESRLRKMTMVSDPTRNLAIGPVGNAPSGRRADAEATADLLRRDLLGPDADDAIDLVTARLAQSELDARRAQKSVAKLSAYLKSQRTLLAMIPSRRPTLGYKTSSFGMRVDPFTGLPQLHAGMDFSAAIGVRVMATADGTVLWASTRGAYGETVEIEHINGLTTRYAHLSRIDVKVGQK
ncbi:MAG: M23 family metallopeptidase, partial [Myxococcota bacterium]